MIDLKAKRAELQEAVQKSENTKRQCDSHITFLNGAITLLNELIADAEKPTVIEGWGNCPECGVAEGHMHSVSAAVGPWRSWINWSKHAEHTS